MVKREVLPSENIIIWKLSKNPIRLKHEYNKVYKVAFMILPISSKKTDTVSTEISKQTASKQIDN